MTVRTDPRRRALTREELLSMTIQTRRMLWKLSDVRKRRVALANFFPVFGGKLMTRITREFVFGHVSGMREPGVIDRRRACASLRVDRHDAQSKSNYQKCS
jgi:hypothetical protein